MMATSTRRISANARPTLPRVSPHSIPITPGGRWSTRRNNAGVPLCSKHQAEPHRPQRDPAADRDPELRQHVLVNVAAGPDPDQSPPRLDPLPATVVVVAVVAPPPRANADTADEDDPVVAKMAMTIVPVPGLAFPV